ncbi:traB domain-containing protein-like [Mya arenaria]|uniref:traB domain-containing protein-like n=1 Tax=Mya arenaria TaxID=6604 RepID=UPI0022E00841|nr:traB domain-containing protein-like [Mya arenaria]
MESKEGGGDGLVEDKPTSITDSLVVINKEEAKESDQEEIPEEIEGDEKSDQQDTEDEFVYSDDFEPSNGEESDIEDNDQPNGEAYVAKVRIPNPVLPETVTELETSWGSKIYLVGTAHFSSESQDDVTKTIVATQPDVVMVELCNSRMNILQYDEETLLREAKDISLVKVRQLIQQSGFLQGVMHVFFLQMSAHLTEQLGMAPGGEFRRAFHEAKKIPNCRLQLGDRPIQITLSRALSSLSWWQTIKLAYHLITSKDSISKEDVEKCKQKDLLEEMLKEMTGEFPGLSRVFVQERDTFLAHALKHAAQPLPNPDDPTGHIPSVVVGVVGMGHVPGIKINWETPQFDMREICKMPEKSLGSKVVRTCIKIGVLGCGLSLIGLSTFGCYKLYKWTGFMKT